ncbi:transglutaminase domain-containing protein [Paenibacillus aurantius]|uniref:Transglutaminase domain-containing protein n=1 Tax=Paenibacillus aurantius TaxID=2918900 RepID=A0AA96RIW3_9BACL|nr:transglutaminase domain-containing protein [Paenibacillus aurantius]WNQ12614.1 transglutaminase domain-containing protein [Paenibacillus aurantius]
MAEWLKAIPPVNLLSAAIVLVVAASVIQGARRGAAGSARQLVYAAGELAATVLGILLAWKLTGWLSPQVQAWLTAKGIEVPNRELDALSQLYYTFVTGLRDFSLMRSAILFLIVYSVVKLIASRILYLLVHEGMGVATGQGRSEGGVRGFLSSLSGAILGSVAGIGRALLVIACLFVVTSLFPQSGAAQYIQKSGLYQAGATAVIKPVTGKWISEQLPVLTRSMESEFNKILQRKYEVVDANIPDNIAEAAQEVTAKAKTDEEKARALYQWIGTRVQYDYGKVDLYEQKGIWKEQTPEDTFETRKGVCIDYSRLYSVMAKSVGLESKVVTGLGYDGKGGYGPHAWNEVKLAQGWVPLDSTWVSSGLNWFNPANFDETHIRQV